MTWTLALSVASSGVGVAKIGAKGFPEIVGLYPEVTRAMRFAGEGESTRNPEKVVLVVPTTLSEYDLKWYLGEIAISGAPASDIQVRSVHEVLGKIHPGELLLADASWKSISLTSGQTANLTPVKLYEYAMSDKAPSSVIIAGHPQERGEFEADIVELNPVLIEHPEIAVIALEHPTTDSLVSIPEESASVSADTGAWSMPKAGKIVPLFVIGLLIILAISFMF